MHVNTHACRIKVTNKLYGTLAQCKILRNIIILMSIAAYLYTLDIQLILLQFTAALHAHFIYEAV